MAITPGEVRRAVHRTAWFAVALQRQGATERDAAVHVLCPVRQRHVALNCNTKRHGRAAHVRGCEGMEKRVRRKPQHRDACYSVANCCARTACVIGCTVRVAMFCAPSATQRSRRGGRGRRPRRPRGRPRRDGR